MWTRKKVGLSGAILAGTGLACTGALIASAIATSKIASAIATSKRGSTRLQGKVVLITGASRGLGLALAEEFGRRGAKLALAARSAEELERARFLLLHRKAIRTADEVFLFASDLRKPEEADQLIRETTAHFGRIDILVNNAGVITVGPVANLTLQDFRDVMDANFFSGLHCTLSVLPQMLPRGDGNIVNITSIGGKIAVPHLLPYTASKFAAVGFSEGLNAELRSKGIRVTTVCPGLMRTGSHLNAFFTGDAAREYRWFSLAAGFPGLSASARSAARKIVRAVAVGKSEIAITPQAMLAARFGNLSPTTTMRLMQMMNVALPSSVPVSTPPCRGANVRDLEITPAMVLAQSAARRYNQITSATAGRYTE
jgi:NAD(P)-dependent dehydrogenase (short-subunit alcohol dehydrogenase family)